MKNDKLISIRLPSEVYDQIVTISRERKQSMSAFIKAALVASTWRIELRRNRAYHREMLKRIKEVENMMKESERLTRG